MTFTSDQPLDYAPTSSLRKRRIARRIIISAIVLLIIAILVQQGPGMWHRLSLYYWQQKCLSHVQPPTTVIAEFDNGRVKSAITPREWDEFYSLLSPPGFRSSGTVLVHRLTNKKGKRRLVAVDVSTGWALSIQVLSFTCRVFEPGTPISVAKLLPDTSSKLPLPFAENVSKIYAGQPDADDPQHFTFVILQTNGLTRTYDGWLHEDDSVSIEKRPTPPAPASADQSR